MVYQLPVFYPQGDPLGHSWFLKNNHILNFNNSLSTGPKNFVVTLTNVTTKARIFKRPGFQNPKMPKFNIGGPFEGYTYKKNIY